MALTTISVLTATVGTLEPAMVKQARLAQGPPCGASCRLPILGLAVPLVPTSDVTLDIRAVPSVAQGCVR